MNARTLRLAAGLATIACALATPAAALGWWNDEWPARKAFRIDTSAAGAAITEPIGPVAVLVRLHQGNFRFDAAKEDGSDLRFVAADDRTPLAFHLEKYDALLGEALAWVAVPDLKPGATVELWLYHGNTKAAPAEDAKKTYDPATALVYHFAERGAPPRDSSAAGAHAQSAAGSADGALVGRGLRLDGSNAVIVPATPSLAWAGGAKVTWSAWVRPAAADGSGTIFVRRDGAASFVVGAEGGRPYVEVAGDAGPQRASAAGVLAANRWHHLAVTAGEAIQLWLDGAPAARLAAALPALDVPSVVGAAGPPTAGALAAPKGKGAKAGRPEAAAGFAGDLDELQIANAERPAGWIRASALSQGTEPDELLAAGPDEESGSWSSGYLAILVKSVTLDGWVVIALLAVMAIVSWVVMASKASYLGAVEKANERFDLQFRHLSSDLAKLVATNGASPLSDEALVRNSPSCRIFQIGAEEVRKRTGAGRPLSAEAIEAVRASLDAGLVRENQRLTRRMVLLTIAISGGPFLGLLGTVVGVMITFASIAAAGDVNVNAIAPGIAAALVATVAGLGVAIPALFGYNWLLTRIKDVTATLQVFVDEFVTKLAEAYALDEPREGHLPRGLAARE
jgi:biopolymer transport protein ExbB